jgi:hypothetical protein
MSSENAITNLQALAEVLGVEGPQWDENGACCLELADGFTVHFIYDKLSDHLFIFAPLLDHLPKVLEERLKLYEKLLEFSVEFARARMGNLGLDAQNDMILIYDKVPMHEKDRRHLLLFLPHFIQSIKIWKEVIEQVPDSGSSKSQKLSGFKI